ncbi:MAG: heme oxygenase (biliverdin-producing) [Sarcina sp.]
MSHTFANLLREKNKNLHEIAKQTGFNARLVAGKATNESYVQFLGNIKLAYDALENNLDENIGLEILGPFVTKELYRAKHIEQDLINFLGEDYEKKINYTPSSLAYAGRINEIGRNHPVLLIAHAYTRFLADLFGGRIIHDILHETYKLEDKFLNYYKFNELPDLKGYAIEYVEALDTLEIDLETKQLFLNEVANAYLYNIGISNELEYNLFK